MKRLILVLSVLALLPGVYSCTSQGNKKEASQVITTSDVNVYYFHFTQRCATCIAVEETARMAVETLFPDQVKSGEYSFASLNLDDEGTKDIADRLGIGGQSLVIVCGDKKIDITSTAWLAARDPDKMKAEIKSGIDKVRL